MAVIRTGKTAIKSVPTPGRTSFVLGSRPRNIRTPTPGLPPKPSIVPQAASTTQYGKNKAPISAPGFGDTGLTGES